MSKKYVCNFQFRAIVQEEDCETGTWETWSAFFEDDWLYLIEFLAKYGRPTASNKTVKVIDDIIEKLTKEKAKVVDFLSVEDKYWEAENERCGELKIPNVPPHI